MSSLSYHFHDQCGVFAMVGNQEASNIAYLGLHGLQHRGQESAGIVTSDGDRLHAYRRRVSTSPP